MHVQKVKKSDVISESDSDSDMTINPRNTPVIITLLFNSLSGHLKLVHIHNLYYNAA